MNNVKTMVAQLRRQIEMLEPGPVAVDQLLGRIGREQSAILDGDGLPEFAPPYPLADEDAEKFLAVLGVTMNPTGRVGEHETPEFDVRVDRRSAPRLWALAQVQRLGLENDPRYASLWPTPDLAEEPAVELSTLWDNPGNRPRWWPALMSTLAAVEDEARAATPPRRV